jgi:ribosomal protein L21
MKKHYENQDLVESIKHYFNYFDWLFTQLIKLKLKDANFEWEKLSIQMGLNERTEEIKDKILNELINNKNKDVIVGHINKQYNNKLNYFIKLKKPHEELQKNVMVDDIVYMQSSTGEIEVINNGKIELNEDEKRENQINLSKINNVIYCIKGCYKLLIDTINPAPTDPPKQENKLIILPDVLLWLQETKCSNGKPFIENRTGQTYIWLQNKQLARELLTHNKIKWNLTDAEIARQTLKLFIYHRDGKPLKLAGNKPTKDKRNHSVLMNFLATL